MNYLKNKLIITFIILSLFIPIKLSANTNLTVTNVSAPNTNLSATSSEYKLAGTVSFLINGGAHTGTSCDDSSCWDIGTAGISARFYGRTESGGAATLIQTLSWTYSNRNNYINNYAYSFSNADRANYKYYYVVVNAFSQYGNYLPGSSYISVTANNYDCPYIIKNLVDTSTFIGQDTSNQLDATCAILDETYKWQRQGPDETWYDLKDEDNIDNKTYSGTTTNSLMIVNPIFDDSGAKFRCIVTGTTSVTSNISTLTVLDNIKPTIKLEQTAKETTEYTNVIVHSTDIGSGISGFSKDNINYQDSNVFKITQNGTITFYVKDKVGNVSSKSIIINNIGVNTNTIYQIQEDGNLYDPVTDTTLNVDFKGTGATGGTVEVNKDREIVRATLEINKRTVSYEKSKAFFATVNVESTYKNNILNFKGINLLYYAITKTETIPTDWIRIDTTSNIEIDLTKFNLDKGTYYGWVQDSEGKISDPIEMVIEWIKVLH